MIGQSRKTVERRKVVPAAAFKRGHSDACFLQQHFDALHTIVLNQVECRWCLTRCGNAMCGLAFKNQLIIWGQAKRPFVSFFRAVTFLFSPAQM